MSQCRLCEKDFVDYQGRNRTKCGSCNTKIRRFRTKLKAVKYLGGSCLDCGYDTNIVALEFHHTDPTEKDFNISKAYNKSWPSVVTELDKCVLLCSICHKIRHHVRDQTFIDEAMKYNFKFD